MSDHAVQTYRYLRIGIIGAVVLLGLSILIERGEVDCWQTSISGYYYTPVRAILVGTLIGVGFALIVIKDRLMWVDVSLNFAGMLAPLVAVIPTANVGECWSVDPPASPLNPDGTLATWVVANIDNNVWALILTGYLGIVAWGVIVAITRTLRTQFGDFSASLKWGLGVTVTFLTAVLLAFRLWDDFYDRAHGLAAVGLFVFLAIAVFLNAREVHEDKKVYFWLYVGILLMMFVAALPLLFSNWEHNVLIVEASEIFLFGVFWSVQTAEQWDDDPALASTTSS